jgi:signal transduction histidine kinase
MRDLFSHLPPSRRTLALFDSIVLALIVLGLLVTITPPLIFQDPDYTYFGYYAPVMLAALAGSAIAVLAARLYAVSLGAAALIATLFLLIPATVMAAPTISRLNFLAFYILPVLLTNIFFGYRPMIFTAALALVSMITLAQVLPDIEMSDFFAGPGALFLVIVAISLIAQRYRDLVESDRCANLIDAERLRADLKIAHELDATKSHLMRMISHEFRTPITMIRTSSELLQRYIERMTPEQRSERFDTIYREIDFLNSMIDDVATVTRLQSGRFQLQFKPLNLQVFCLELIAAFERQIASDHIFSFESAGNLTGVPVDETLLRHILSNLLSNAAKYSPPGSEVLLRVENHVGELLIIVRDQGIGIPESDRSHLFEPFFRGSNTESRPGSGLGTKIIADSVRLYQGSITYESTVGIGTTFFIRLPVPRLSSPSQ